MQKALGDYDHKMQTMASVSLYYLGFFFCSDSCQIALDINFGVKCARPEELHTYRSEVIS